jgi:hypothetical protein
MGIDIAKIIKDVLLESTVPTITDTQSPDHWIKKVCDKVLADLKFNIDKEKLSQFYRIFAGKPGTYIASKNITEPSGISLYDLLHTLLELVYTDSFGSLAWEVPRTVTAASVTTSPSVAGRVDFISLVQRRYELPSDPVKSFIDKWLTSHIEEENYTINSPKVAKAYMEARKELETLERAAFSTYANHTILTSLLEVVKKRVSAKERIKTTLTNMGRAVLRLDSLSPFEDLIKNIMLNAEGFASGDTTGTEYSSIVKKLLNMRGALSGQFLSALAQEVDDIYPKSIITYCLHCRELFLSEAATYGAKIYNEQYPSDTEAGRGDVALAGATADQTKAFLNFVKNGILECKVYVTQYVKGGANRQLVDVYNARYTMSRIESIKSEESKRVTQDFKNLCVYVSTKGKEKTNLSGALWAASGHSLYNR